MKLFIILIKGKIDLHKKIYTLEEQVYTLYYKIASSDNYSILKADSTSPIPLSFEYFINYERYDFYVECTDKYGRKIQSKVYNVEVYIEHSGGGSTG